MLISHFQPTAVVNCAYNAPLSDVAAQVAAGCASLEGALCRMLAAKIIPTQVHTGLRGVDDVTILLIVKTRLIPDLATRVIAHYYAKRFVVIHCIHVNWARS